ncbi:MAG: acyl carrier protein [Clostridiales bacterium]|jgi:acyl carrier protein|nr:acyl carrier protein [Clostridiales bacterium]
MFEKVCEIISAQLDVDASAITMEAKLVDDLKADSLDVVELIMDLEQEFDVNIPDEELPKVRTVGDIINYLQKKE